MKKTMVFYRTTMIDTLVRFSLYNEGILIPSTSDAVQMLMMSVIMAVESMADFSEQQVEGILSIVQRIASKSKDLSPSLTKIRSIVTAASSLFLKRLSSINLPQGQGTTTPLQAGRRLSDSEKVFPDSLISDHDIPMLLY